MINQPLVVSDRLFLPEGSHLEGSVLQVRPARRLGRNGLLRITFHQVVPPSGVEEKIEATLEGVDVNKGENLTLDSEGGAQVTTPKTRYLTTRHCCDVGGVVGIPRWRSRPLSRCRWRRRHGWRRSQRCIRIQACRHPSRSLRSLAGRRHRLWLLRSCRVCLFTFFG